MARTLPGGDDPFVPGARLLLGDAPVHRSDVTLLLADIAGFTALAGALDPEKVVALLDRFFALVQRAIGDEGGLVDRFLGDACQAIFVEQQGRAPAVERAIRAARSIQRKVVSTIEGISVTCAIEYGEATAALVDSGSRAELMLLGPAVTEVARVQKLCAPGEVRLGPNARKRVPSVVADEKSDGSFVVPAIESDTIEASVSWIVLSARSEAEAALGRLASACDGMRRSGRSAEARERVEEALEAAMCSRKIEWLARLRLLEGILFFGEGSLEEAAASLQLAEASARTLAERACASLLLAALCLDAGRVADAAVWLQRARGGIDDALAPAARALALRLGPEDSRPVGG